MPTHGNKSRGKSIRASAATLKRKKDVVVRVTRGTLLAVGLAIAQVGDEQAFFDKKFFEAGVLDRLQAPITRYHE